jgi:hypothetical protein
MLFPCPACNSARLFGSLSVTVVTCGLTRDKLVKISIRQENQLDDWGSPSPSCISRHRGSRSRPTGHPSSIRIWYSQASHLVPHRASCTDKITAAVLNNTTSHRIVAFISCTTVDSALEPRETQRLSTAIRPPLPSSTVGDESHRGFNKI